MMKVNHCHAELLIKLGSVVRGAIKPWLSWFNDWDSISDALFRVWVVPILSEVTLGSRS